MASQKQSGRGQGSASRGAAAGTSGRGRAAATAKSSGAPRGQAATAGSARTGKAAAARGRAPSARQAGAGRGGAATTTGQSGGKAAANGAAAGRNGLAVGASAGSASRGGLLRPLRPFLAMTPFQVVAFLLTLAGLGVSIYLTIAHYDTQVTLICSDKGLVNCEEVTTSSQSMVFGIFPVAVLGLAFYVFLTFLNSPWMWRWQQAPPRWLASLASGARFGSADAAVRWIRLGSLVVGMGFVLYLIYVELIQIGAICLWCTSVHVVTFLLFCLFVFDATFHWDRAGTA